MILKSHSVKNYRNIEDIEITPAETVTVISGENGQGKTNLLESIWLLSGAKSFRSSKDEDLIQIGADFSAITAVVEEKGEELQEKEIKIIIGSEKAQKKGRFASVNGVDYGRATNLAGVFYCVVFEPGHLFLVKGAPATRRKWIDAALCQLYPGYIETYKRFIRILSQKNALLRDIKKSKTKKKQELLNVLNEHFAIYSTKVVQKRRQYIEDISPFLSEKYSNIARGKEKVSVFCNFSEEEKEEFAKELEKNRESEIRAGFSLVGPHRDDIDIFLDEKDAKVYASQGQQRSIALCLKLAEAQQIEKVTGEIPIILLDDVLSELDTHRKNYLLQDLTEKQVIITSCEADFLVNNGGKIYRIENGKIV